jgi:hypothetical protein
MDNESRRAHPRFPFKMKVRITTENYCARHVITEDFSDGGIFVTDDVLAELDVGSLISVQSDEDLEHRPIVQARIAWTNNTGAGIEYLLDDED